MSATSVLAALDLPAECRIDIRVPKTVLLNHSAPTAADKRVIRDGIATAHWRAAIKPQTVGVPEFRDEVREYVEIAVLEIALQSSAKVGRLTELIHRAIPYPVVLITTQGGQVALSLAHKRWSQSEARATVLDSEVISVDLTAAAYEQFTESFLASLALARKPRSSLYALYQGWFDSIVGLLIAGMSGTFSVTRAPEQATVRLEAFRKCLRLESEIDRLRKAAKREKQLARQVELNLEVKRLTQLLSGARLLLS